MAQKILEMFEKYGNNYYDILKGNQQADLLCTSHPFPIIPTPTNSPFLDGYFLCKNDIPLFNLNHFIL